MPLIQAPPPKPIANITNHATPADLPVYFDDSRCKSSFHFNEKDKTCTVHLTFQTDNHAVTCTPVTPIKDGQQKMDCSYAVPEYKSKSDAN